jgi:signal transduction histidine kinase
MGVPIVETKRVLQQFVITLIVGLAVVTVIAIIAGGFLVKLALSPVEAIRASAEKITYGNVSQRLAEINTGDPIEHLSKTLNQMLDRLDQSYQNASRFSSDASHELRTPLAIIRSDLETLQKDKSLNFETHDRLGSILEEIERLSAIVESLLSIARLEAGEAKAKNEVINLSELVQSTIEQMQLLADEKNISVAINASSPVLIGGDVARIRQVIVNLFDNAVKYTPQFGKVVVSVFAEAGAAVLVLKDNGVGISADALPYIFERFYRADKVRSSTSQGTGLGLYIVRTICQAHGGVIDVQSIEGQGTQVKIELPLQKSAASV